MKTIRLAIYDDEEIDAIVSFNQLSILLFFFGNFLIRKGNNIFQHLIDSHDI